MQAKLLTEIFLASFEAHYSAQAIQARAERRKAIAAIQARLEQAKLDARQVRETSAHLS